MLPRYYKVRVYNDAGVSVTIQVNWNAYKIGSGSPTYAGDANLIASAPVSSPGSVLSAAQDNLASGGNIGGHIMVFATPGGAPSGNKQLLVYLIGSNDNTNFEDIQSAVGEANGTLIGIMPLSGTGAQHLPFEV